ncbi:Hypothetical protein HVR_LOCUS1293 [uncultured virus]|nr:Hypothetical protein HVR_LOCUS1293 [uncultured virus]
MNDTESAANLVSADSEVWSATALLIISHKYRPKILSEEMFKTCSSSVQHLKYRGVYYYSDNSGLPYVRLLDFKTLPLPVVACCNKISYDSFKQAYDQGDFSKHDCTI